MKKDSSRKIILTNEKEGQERREEVFGAVTENGTYLPKPIDYFDIDKGVMSFVESDLDITLKGEKLPIFFLSIQKWSEFTRTWGNSDEYKDVKMPFITIVRDPNIQDGTIHDGLFDVAGFPTFSYHKVPTFRNGREGYDIYKIPQPTASDLTYHIRFFTNKMKELNVMQNKVQRTFKSRQFYINVLGHPMPIVLEGVNDESRIDDIDSRRYYAIDFEVVVNGYILNEDDFEVTPAVDRSLVIMESDVKSQLKPMLKKSFNRELKKVSFDVTFKHNSVNNISIKLNEGLKINNIKNDFNIDQIKYTKNGHVVDEFPFTVLRNDVLGIIIERTEKSLANLIIEGDIYPNYDE